MFAKYIVQALLLYSLNLTGNVKNCTLISHFVSPSGDFVPQTPTGALPPSLTGWLPSPNLLARPCTTWISSTVNTCNQKFCDKTWKSLKKDGKKERNRRKCEEKGRDWGGKERQREVGDFSAALSFDWSKLLPCISAYHRVLKDF